ncbi:MAG: hypothetical protein S4CHLAM45_14710 [Chlamydiales bacterium]|nr:hypothetical protein [Chlamydiales bacterium]MCH9620567.1 hypothetical protein [Chlamydiales bacterium]MCH9623561.1 hypothetical protein [Chlamydiales bacterium]
MVISYTGFEQCFIREGRPFFPTVDTVEILSLDMRRTSTLKWENPSTDRLTLWEFETDLWEVPFPDEGEIRAFERAIDHFIETLYVPEKCFGILLYKGGIDLPRDLIKSIAARLPDGAFPLLAIDGSGLSTEALLSHLKREELLHFGLILKGGTHPYAVPAMGWDQSSPFGVYGKGELLPQKTIPLALCQPEEGEFTMPDQPCRVIPESLLIYEWEGVDELIVPSVSKEGQRKVNGFLATGGKVLS